MEIKSNNPYADIEQKQNEYLKQQEEMLNQQSQMQEQVTDDNTNQIINEINQQKEYANQNFEKEARAGNIDYLKKINPYGTEAEKIAQQGLGKTGYSESSNVNAYNTYQNRYATAKSTTDKIQSDFQNEINQAKLEGNKDKAQIALNKLKMKMENLANDLNFSATLNQNKISQDNWLNEFNYNKQQNNWQNAFNQNQFDYGKQQDSWQNQFAQNQFDYGKQQDSLANSLAREEFEYQKKKVNTANKSYNFDEDNTSNSTLSGKGQNWYDKMTKIEKLYNRPMTVEDFKYGMAEAIKQGMLSEEDADIILKNRGY